MPAEPCKECQTLSTAVADAIGALYQVKSLYDEAKKIKGKDITNLQAAFTLAWRGELVATEKLHAHIDAHALQSLI